MAGSIVARDFFGHFDARFLGWLLGFGAIAVIFLFYFNRLLAFVLFTLIRAYTWFFYKVHVKCQSIQVSLLGGRIFLRGLSYHGKNETILIHQLYVTWQYWYRRVADVDVSKPASRKKSTESTSESSEAKRENTPSDNESASRRSKRNTKCRIAAQVRGVEWFVYNRSPAYDAIVASASQAASADGQNHEDGFETKETAPNLRASYMKDGKGASVADMDQSQYQQNEEPQLEPPVFLRLFPIQLDCTKAAMVMGNDHTRSVLVAKIESAKGKINAHSSGVLDIYRQSFEFELAKPVIRFVPNEDYVEPLLTAGARLNGSEESPHKKQDNTGESKRPKISRHRTRHALSKLLPQFRTSVESFERRSGSLRRGDQIFPVDMTGSGIPRWIGLTRYLDEEEEDQLEHNRWQGIEYAEAQKIAEFSTIGMHFYWDIPGNVVASEKLAKVDSEASESGDINGSVPPAYGVELHLGQGIVQYGPWADRQRVDFMTVFFPSGYMNTLPALPIRIGQARVNTVFQISIILDEDVELRLLTREPSKDWKFKEVGQQNGIDGKNHRRGKQAKGTKPVKQPFEPLERPAGWLSVSIAANTAVSYDMDMVARKTGFKNSLSIDVVSLKLQSSVNSDTLLQSSSMTVSADISNPLEWNTTRTWRFDVSAYETDLFMLREHAFLIQDLVEDFTLGPPPSYYTFVPFIYELRLNFDKFKVYLNANEANIIDKPSDLNENIFLLLEPRRLEAKVTIPSDQLNPSLTKIGFDGNLSDTKFWMLTPAWNTYSTLFQNSPIGVFPSIIANGSYTYCASSSPNNTDTLLMDIHGDNPKMYLYGFLIRYFLNFQENYFGRDVHFQTIEEYQSRVDKPGRNHASDNEHKPAKSSSDLDVILSIVTKNPNIVLPSNLYTNQNCVKIDLQDGRADLRFTNYYMDLQTSLSPLSITHSVQTMNPAGGRDADDLGVQTFIDGATITGHRLFGLPPDEPTYACNWDFEVGDISGESSMEFLGALFSGIQAFIHGFDDKENALPNQEESTMNDVTFIRAAVNPIKLWLLVDNLAFLCEISASRVEFNDWARRRFSERLLMIIPSIKFAVVDRVSTESLSSDSNNATTYGYLQTSLDFRMLQSKANFRDERHRQQEHIRLHDARTSRTPWLIREHGSMNDSHFQHRIAKLQPPASQYPPIPEPLKAGSAVGSGSLRSKSSSSTMSKRKQNSFLLRVDSGDHFEASAGQAQPPSSRFAGELGHGELSQVSKACQGHHEPTKRHRGHAATLTSPYERPRFPFHDVEPSDRDVPLLFASAAGLQSQDDSGVTIEDLPIEDDGIIHVSLMINLESGLRVLCTPPALEGVNQLVDRVKSRKPSEMLDVLQIDSLNAVAASRNPDKPPKTTQIRLELPGAAFRIRHHHTDQLTAVDAKQAYEIALYRLTVFGRLGAQRPSPLGKMPSSMHISLDQLEIEATRGSTIQVNDARVIGKLSDLTCWIHEAEEITGHLQFRAFEIASLNRRTENLSALVNDAGSLADRLASAFKATLVSQTGRVQYLVYHLMTTGQHVADPSILSSASFISRSSGDHVRASDSWKMLMRLRWIYRSMDANAQAHLAEICAKDVVPIPEDAQSQVIFCFKDWREWDLVDIRTCAMMRELYGKAAPASEEFPEEFLKPIRLAFASGLISLTIDPAQRGNRIISEGLALAVESSLEINESEKGIAELDLAKRRTSIETSCDGILVELRLELLDAVEGIFSHVKQLEASEAPPLPTLAQGPPKAFVRQELHLVTVVKKGEIRLRTPNLKTALQSEYMYGSVLGHRFTPVLTKGSATLISQSCSLSSTSHRRSLLDLTIARPSMFASFDRFIAGNKAKNVWRVGVQSRQISSDLAQNALSILAILDQMVNDEFAYLQDFLVNVKSASGNSPAAASDIPTDETCLDLTIRLDSYRLTTAIFSSLRYRLEGNGVGILFKTDPSDKNVQNVHLDIMEHAHSIFNGEGDSRYEIGRLVLPPINSKIDLKQGDSVIKLDVDVHMSPVRIDASSIHGVFTTLSRTELLRFGRNVSRDFAVVKSNLENATSNTSESETIKLDHIEPSEPRGRDVIFAARLRLDGVSIIAHSSKSLKTSAELVLDSGPISFGVSNEQSETGTILSFPDIDLRLTTIRILLESLQDNRRVPCGSVALALSVFGRSEYVDGNLLPSFNAAIDRFDVDIYTETASMIVDILGYLQQRFKNFNLTEELHTLRAKRRRRTKSNVKTVHTDLQDFSEDDTQAALFDAVVSFQLHHLQMAWRVGNMEVMTPTAEPEDLIFSIKSVSLRTKRGNTARLEIKDLQLQMVPTSQSATQRSKNSALLPEVVFKVAYLSKLKGRRLAFQALGQKLDLRLTSQFILPLTNIQRSIAVATQDLRTVLDDWNETLVKGDSSTKSVLGDKKLVSLIVDADFAGAEVLMEGRNASDRLKGRTNRMSQHGRLGQYEDRNRTTLRSPGLAFKVEYQDSIDLGRSLNAEVKVAASKNELRPMFVPLVLEVISSVKELVGQPTKQQESVETKQADDSSKDVSPSMTDPTAILGDCRLNLGFRICEQSFSLTCEPIAKVTATAKIDDVYVTVSTVQPEEGERFFAVSSAITGLETTVRHVFSRDPTGKFTVKSIDMSLMNSEHVNGMKGISSILNISPTEVFLNVKQLQDFLTFREIWYPVEIRPAPQAPAPSSDQTIGGVQRYYQATATNSFSWNAAINIASLDLRLDLGQSVGRMSFSISRLWMMSRKDSAQEQNLCLGFDAIGAKSEGRMSGSVELRNFRLRTNIVWQKDPLLARTPLVQASLIFGDLRAKAAFDYQTFAVADFQSLGFILYNTTGREGDRLICAVNGDKIHAYCTANVASQSVALYQAIERLIQEKTAAFEVSLQQMEKFQRQKAAAGLGLSVSQELSSSAIANNDTELTPLRLQVNVVVSLNALKVGVYPRAFTDNQIFKLEALDALARFGVNIRDGHTHTLLTVILGQLRVALSNVNRDQRPKGLGEVHIEDVVKDSVASRGGTILKVPRVVATMQTWQPLHTKQVEYVFSSTFEGKVEVGWNYARISSIRTMWDTHSKALVARLGKPLPQPALQITSSPRPDTHRGNEGKESPEEDPAKPAQELITAVVNVPLSKYTYQAREPPVIQTPQLRDMGEATPPLEWIGLQRDKLPNLTHQIVIVPLLEFAKEVEDAYGKILGAT